MRAKQQLGTIRESAGTVVCTTHNLRHAVGAARDHHHNLLPPATTPAVLVEGAEGGEGGQEREVVYALYARTDPRKETRPQYVEVGWLPVVGQHAGSLCAVCACEAAPCLGSRRQRDTHASRLQRLHPLLLQYGAGVGDVLLLRPLGPGRLCAELLKAHTEVGGSRLVQVAFPCICCVPETDVVCMVLPVGCAGGSHGA